MCVCIKYASNTGICKYIYLHLYMFIHVLMLICLCASVHICIHIHTSISNMRKVDTHIRIRTHIYVYGYMHICVYVYVCIVNEQIIHDTCEPRSILLVRMKDMFIEVIVFFNVSPAVSLLHQKIIQNGFFMLNAAKLGIGGLLSRCAWPKAWGGAGGASNLTWYVRSFYLRWHSLAP